MASCDNGLAICLFSVDSSNIIDRNTVGNTADPSPDAHTPAERARQAYHGIGKTYGFWE
ncbi:hypothetical protein [Microcoleus sp. S36b_A4]|uniref:hypothetical protein n=1 Tax=Microcoleus sp. S36b_A4 TaxID=3055420 RepID=UPI002FD29798